ncbi:hypothetical protein GCM10028805_48390 [Spirosoma harenae]
MVDLHEAVSLIVEQQYMPLDDDPVLRGRISKVEGQIKRGEYITNDEMKRQVQQWLTE